MEALTFGLTVAVIGVGIVFIELIFLVFIIKGISWATCSFNQKKNKIEAAVIETAIETDTVIPEQSGISEEEVVVISAAIAHLLAGETRIKTITRKPGIRLNPWTMAGSMEIMQARQI